MTVGPCPLARSSLAAMKYTADLPQPVRCTTSARRRCTTSASMASPLVVAQDGLRSGQLFEDRLRLLAGCSCGPIVPAGPTANDQAAPQGGASGRWRGDRAAR